MAFPEDVEVIGFEEGMSWLSSQVLDDAFSDTTTTNNKRHVKGQLHQQHRYLPKLPAETLSQHSKNSPRACHSPKYPTNRASRGTGMQAIFLESGQRSCGTGVFLPQRAGTNFQPTRNSACSPVLLPSRVVRALNLKIPRPIINQRVGSAIEGKIRDAMMYQENAQSQNYSAQIFLPKDWTY